MPTCRDIPAKLWKVAFQALVFYFSRRGQVSNAEDLAQRTFLAILKRDDFEFGREEDFLRVCYGFAARILKAKKREDAKSSSVPLDTALPVASNRDGAQATEDTVFLHDVLEIGKTELTPDEWKFIEDAAEAALDNLPYNFPRAEANTLRVRLYRLRKKLAKKTGWNQ
jgi:hypothetical protein